MVRLARLWFTFLLVALLFPFAGDATAFEKRVALVIGNNSYNTLSPLKNPIRDAEAMGSALSSSGFKVYIAQDLSFEKFTEALAFFKEETAFADTRVVYYAGHGAQQNGQHLLLATDYKLGGKAISVKEITDTLASPHQTTVMLVDSCLDNLGSEGNSTANMFSDLQVSKPQSEFFLALATTPGQAAYDSTRGHGLFTGALLDQLANPAQDIETMMRKVRREVLTASNGLQLPVTVSTLLSGFAFSQSKDQEPTIQNAISQLENMGFGDKPILARISGGLAQDIETKDRTETVISQICKQLSGALPPQCFERIPQ